MQSSKKKSLLIIRRYWDLAANPDLSRSSYHKDLLKRNHIKSTFQFCSFFSKTKTMFKEYNLKSAPPNTPTNRQLYLVNGGEWWWIASHHQQNISIGIPTIFEHFIVKHKIPKTLDNGIYLISECHIRMFHFFGFFEQN